MHVWQLLYGHTVFQQDNFLDWAQLQGHTGSSWGQACLVVPHSCLLNHSAIQWGMHVPYAYQTLAILSIEQHTHHPLPVWVRMWNGLRDIWKACCLSNYFISLSWAWTFLPSPSFTLCLSKINSNEGWERQSMHASPVFVLRFPPGPLLSLLSHPLLILWKHVTRKGQILCTATICWSLFRKFPPKALLKKNQLFLLKIKLKNNWNLTLQVPKR